MDTDMDEVKVEAIDSPMLAIAADDDDDHRPTKRLRTEEVSSPYVSAEEHAGGASPGGARSRSHTRESQSPIKRNGSHDDECFEEAQMHLDNDGDDPESRGHHLHDHDDFTQPDHQQQPPTHDIPLPATASNSIAPALPQVRYRPHLILRGHQRGVSSVKFSPNGKWLASCCQ